MCARTLALALWLAAAAAWENVTITQMQLSLEETHELLVDPAAEFILHFIPNEEQAQWPQRVWVAAEGGHPARPLLLTYRQRAGAGTWQLPWASGAQLQHELERTLCVDKRDANAASDCEGEQNESPGWVSLHVVAACRQHVRLRVAPARDWPLAFDQPLATTATLTAPRVHYYEFPEGQDDVRLAVSSPDDACATVALQPLGCPIAESLDQLTTTTIRMTVQHSGAVQLSRSRFPRGFVVACVVHETDAACADQDRATDDWLWAAALYGQETHLPPVLTTKKFELRTTAALTRGQYAAAAAATLGVFAAFYAAFGLLVLAQRWPPFARHVAPKAVLAAKPVASPLSQPDTVRDGSRRRDSTATFDSSDNSDSDESDTEVASRPSPATPPGSLATTPGSPVNPPGSRANPPTSPESPVNPPGSPVAVQVHSSTPSSPGLTRTTDTRTPDTEPLDDTPMPDNGNSPMPDNGNSATPPVRSSDGNGIISYADVVDVQNGRSEANGTQNGPSVAGAGAGVGGGGAPFGLPPQLRVAMLARRRARVLRSRADRYLTTLLTVAVFYALPVLQFVFTFQIFLNVSGSLDICYYNFLCAHPAGVLSDFNHVFSNLGYLLLGALFMLQLRRRRAARKAQPRHEEYGIPAHYGLLAALGAGMMVVALLSASYHVCPNRLNFQFDTSFMYVLAVLSMVKIYQSRHPDVNARAHATFGVLGVLIALVVWGVLGGGPLFWGVFTVMHVFAFLLLSLRIYYLGQFRFEKEAIARAARRLYAAPASELRPLYTARLVLLLIANALNWAVALYGLFNQSADFASHLLYVLLGNTLMYMSFYLVMKLLHGERPRWYAWAYTAGAAAFWAAALFFFTWGSSSWAASPARSRHLNHECLALQFYDAHDLWHMLSAVALYLSFNAMLTWDDGLAAVPRTEIAVF